MSHSQFHSTESFILRHAWLNLLDERMTTGRINQVATIGKTALHWNCTGHFRAPPSSGLHDFGQDMPVPPPLQALD